MQRNRKNKAGKYDWLSFSQSYLLIAKLGCQEIIKPCHNKADHTNFNFEYNIEELIIPVFYNVKHGIEIFIKTINIIAYSKYDEGHDIKELFACLKKKLKSIYLRPFTDCKGNKITQEDINNLPEKLDDIQRLIDEFYNLDLLKKKIGGHFIIFDTKNDIFRYADNKANIQIKWEKFLDKFKGEDIKILKEKIDKIYTLFNDVGFLYDVFLNKKKTL